MDNKSIFFDFLQKVESYKMTDIFYIRQDIPRINKRFSVYHPRHVVYYPLNDLTRLAARECFI